jgi:hypothetical protein
MSKHLMPAMFVKPYQRWNGAAELFISGVLQQTLRGRRNYKKENKFAWTLKK